MTENFRSNNSRLLLGGLGGYGLGTISGAGSRTVIVCNENSTDEHCKWQKFYNKLRIILSLLFILIFIIIVIFYFMQFFQKRKSRR